MARKFLYCIVGLVVLVGAALLVLRVWSDELTRFAFVPRAPFERLAPLPADAYANPAMWLSRPGLRDDPVRYLPDRAPAATPGAAWVFFVHPTSYFARDSWNGPLDDLDSQRRARLFLQGMASAFNAQAAVFAPRYRQAAFGSFLVSRSESHDALAVAHGDVVLAFDTFLKSVPPDAPIVLAGHSQGSLHLLQLLRERVRGTPLAGRVVAAYLAGWPVSPVHDLPAAGLPACTAPDQAGCVMSWMSFAEPAEPKVLLAAARGYQGLDGKPKGMEVPLCTNPLSGGAGGAAPVPASANPGTFVPAIDLTRGQLRPGLAGARCDAATGLLMIGEPPELGPFVLPGNNYHVYDYMLFWQAVRADVTRRTAAWQARHQPTAP